MRSVPTLLVQLVERELAIIAMRVLGVRVSEALAIWRLTVIKKRPEVRAFFSRVSPPPLPPLSKLSWPHKSNEGPPIGKFASGVSCNGVYRYAVHKPGPFPESERVESISMDECRLATAGCRRSRFQTYKRHLMRCSLTKP